MFFITFATQTISLITTMKVFVNRAYGRTELAQLYSPNIGPHAAWQKLKQWMAVHPTLMQQLQAEDYSPRQRTFTPDQVSLIVGALGEP